MQATAGAVRLSAFRAGSAAFLNRAEALPGLDRVAGGELARHRFEAAEQTAAMIYSHYPAVHHPPGKADRPIGGRKHRVPRGSRKIHTAVSRKPAPGRFVKAADHGRCGVQWPMPSRPGGCRFGPAGFGRGPNACQNQGKNERCSGAPPGAPGPHGRCRRSGTDWWISHRRGSRSRARHGSSSVQPRLVRRRHTRSGGGESPGSRKGRGCGGNEAERRAKPLRCCSTLDEAVCCALILPAQPGKFPPAATGAGEPPGKSGWEQEIRASG